MAPSLRFSNPSRFSVLYKTAYGYGASGVKIRRKAQAEWLALMPNAHEGYVSWEKAEAIRTMVSSNVPTSRHHGAPKHGSALLAGLIRCRRCGRKLAIRYSGMKHQIPATAAVAAGWIMPSHAASPSADCVLMTPLKNRFYRSSSPAPSRPPPRPRRKRPVAATRFMMLSTAASKRRVTLPIGHSGNMTRPIPRTGWSRPNWSCDGTRRPLA